MLGPTVSRMCNKTCLRHDYRTSFSANLSWTSQFPDNQHYGIETNAIVNAHQMATKLVPELRDLYYENIQKEKRPSASFLLCQTQPTFHYKLLHRPLRSYYTVLSEVITPSSQKLLRRPLRSYYAVLLEIITPSSQKLLHRPLRSYYTVISEVITPSSQKLLRRPLRSYYVVLSEVITPSS